MSNRSNFLAEDERDSIPGLQRNPVTDPASVQLLYRPVWVMTDIDKKPIPGAPKQRGDYAWIWWGEQLQRILHGWFAPDGHFLCGYHYWYLNFVKIPRQDKLTDSITGWDAPLYRDNDDEIMSLLWRCRQRTKLNGETISARNAAFAKARTIGYTQMEYLGVDSYNFIFNAGRERYIGRAYESDKTKKLEKGWFKKLYSDIIPAFLKTWNGRELVIVEENEDNFAVGFENKDKVKTIHNWIQYRVVSDERSAGVFKGSRMSKITAVEAGLWGGSSLSNFVSENIDSVGAGGEQWGSIVVGGTSNAIINKSSDYRRLWHEPSAWNAQSHFTPKTKALLGYIDLFTGQSEVKRAEAWVMNERKKAEGNSQLAQQGKVENPLTVEEAFEPSVSFAYDQSKLIAQKADVISRELDKFWVSGRIEYVPGSDQQRSYFIEDALFTPESDRGKWWLNKAGKPTDRVPGIHIAGIDDTYLPATEGEKLKARDSKNCMIIWRQASTYFGENSDIPCAMYLDKNTDTSVTFHEFRKGMLLYNIKQTLYEYNHVAFTNWLTEKGEINKLQYVNGKPGLQVKRNKNELTALGFEFIKEDGQNGITLVPLLESLMRWGSNENDDIGSAFHLILWLRNYNRNREFDEVLDYADSLFGRSDEYLKLGQNNFNYAYHTASEDYLQNGRHTRQQSDFILLGDRMNRHQQEYGFDSNY